MKSERALQAKVKGKGAKGESKIRAKLNPVYSRVPVDHRYLGNVIILDDDGNSHQIDHIEIRHNGIFCIETKNISGIIKGKASDDKWTASSKFGRVSFPNPVKQNETHCRVLSSLFNGKYVINSLIVMVQNNGKYLDFDNVINGCSLTKYLRLFDNGVYLSTEEMDDIYQVLSDAASGITNEEHIENIRRRRR